MSQLLAGRYDEAAQALLAASREQPANAQYLSDVAAVQLERARLGLRPDDLPRALAAADRARRLDPSLREAWFNRALAVGALSMPAEARNAWSEYLERDSTSPWAAEARLRLEELRKPTPAAAWSTIEGQLQRSFSASTADQAVRTQMTNARNLLEGTMLPAWAGAVLAGGSGQAELDRVRMMSASMLRVGGDALYSDAVAAIDRADVAGSDRLKALALAHRQYAEAAALFAQDKHAAAAPRLVDARQALARAGSPYQWRAALDFGAVSYFIGQAAAAAPLLEQISARAQQDDYRFIHGRATWQQGLGAFQQGRLSDAQAGYEATLATFESMGDAEQTAAAHSLLAALHFYLGRKDEEWRHRQLALEGVHVSRSPRFKYAILASSAASVRFDAPETALLMQDSILATAKEWGNNAAVADALAQRSATLIALGRTREAADGIAQARAHLRSVPDAAFRQIFELPILAAESDLMRGEHPGEAVEAAERAIKIAEDRGDRTRLPQFHLRLAKANIVWGNLKAAERALAAGIKAFDDERESLTDEGRVSAADESWQLFDTAVQLAIHSRDYERAFALAERARARSLVERRLANDGPTLAEARRLLQPGDVIVALNQFDNELAVWTISRNEIKVVLRPLGRVDAARLAARQQLEIARESAPAASAILYDEIIRPIAPQLRGAAQLSVIPDATYQDVSFAALWNSADRKFLVEDVVVTGAPSFWALAASERNPAPARTDDVMVLSARPQSDGAARAIADVYRRPALLQSADATRDRFIAGAPGHGIVHLVAPAMRNDAFPLLSGVRLADQPGRRHSGLLLGREIAAQSLSHTNLVVLDEVEAGSPNRGEGTLSVARSFLAAGVPAVLGTLPGADENATRDLMIGFHREMTASGSAAKALATIQRNAIQMNGRRLGAWTALVLYGSDR